MLYAWNMVLIVRLSYINVKYTMNNFVHGLTVPVRVFSDVDL